jgi:hypothetical protein
MANFAYIDESGTLVEHEIMTVSLVLLGGRRTPDRISERILKVLYPHLAEDAKALGKKKMHFADMSGKVQNQVASQLAQEKISGVINSHWHTDEEETHPTLFPRYTRMVQLLLYRALEMTTGDLTVIIAEQGSPETYKTALFADLEKTVELFRRRTGVFRKVTFELRSAQSLRGLQIADFYAGAVRKMWLESMTGVETHLCVPYRHVQHQIKLEDYFELE